MRRTLYAALFATALAGSLAACSSEQPAQTAAAPSIAAPAPPVPPATTTSPNAAPKITSPVATAPNAKALGKSPKAAVLEATPKAAPHTTRWVSRGPQPKIDLANTAGQRAPDLGEPSGGNLKTTEELAEQAAPTPPTAADNDLPAFCAQAAPGIQVFQLQPSRDTVVVGQRGTRLVIPARAFEVPANSGPVRLEMREFYSTADIVLAGLGTRSDLGVLETGGMLHLYAAANGQTIGLRPDKQLLVQLPTPRQLPGMQLYEGVSNDASHAPDWQLPGTGLDKMRPEAGELASSTRGRARKALGHWVTLHPPKSTRWPRFEYDRDTFLKEFERLMPNTKADQALLRRKRHIGKDEQRTLRELSLENKTAIRHAIVLDVVVDSTGTLLLPQQLLGDSVLGQKVLAAVRQLPAQRPASFVSRLPHGGRTISTARGSFVVLYTRAGQRRIGFVWDLLDKHLREEMVLEAQRRRAAFARQFTNKTSTPLTLDDGLYYELVAGGLGWINCDRLLDPGPRIEFAVQAPTPATVVSLVFKGQRSILASSRTDGNTAVFEQVPSGQPATIVALRRENGITYLATTAVSLGQATPPDLQFHPVTLDELRTELASL